jgi:hypothetical protein
MSDPGWKGEPWLIERRGRDVHVVPLADLRDHEFSDQCWCGPWRHESFVVVHDAADQRQKYERGELPLQ